MDFADRRLFENCSQLVNLIRYQLGDPQEFANKCHFPTSSYFAFVESNRDYYNNDDGVPHRHTINFSWIILGKHLSGELKEPEVVSPLITVESCQRHWKLTMKAIRGMGSSPLELDVYLTCGFCKDTSISANVKMDLYKATDKIGDDAVTNVSFDQMVDRHVVYTGAIRKNLEETRSANEDLSKAYTIQGILNLTNCCVDPLKYLPHLEPGFPHLEPGFPTLEPGFPPMF